LADTASAPCLLSSDGARCLFTRSSGTQTEFWVVPASGGKPRQLARGAISFPFWSADSSRVLFLRQAPETGLSEIREAALDGTEKLVTHTSRFAAFSPNHDDSVFVGASASKAQPLILLTLRSTQRELPLCEHHAGDAGSADPVFSPDNRRVYFQSTRDGHAALYSVNTESFVEAAS
jgi:Tol biopolymer transport system component